MYHKKQSGFTLMEVLIYIGLTAVVVIPLLIFAWTLVRDQIKVQRVAEVEYVADQVTDVLGDTIRSAYSIQNGTVYGVDLGTIELLNHDGETVTIDTYPVTVNLVGHDATIRRLRLTTGKNAPIDLTSDRANVLNFIVTDVSKGGSSALQVDLHISSLNPTNDQIYEANTQLRQVFTVRE